MNTSRDWNGLPDEATLERIANDLFLAAPEAGHQIGPPDSADTAPSGTPSLNPVLTGLDDGPDHTWHSATMPEVTPGTQIAEKPATGYLSQIDSLAQQALSAIPALGADFNPIALPQDEKLQLIIKQISSEGARDAAPFNGAAGGGPNFYFLDDARLSNPAGVQTPGFQESTYSAPANVAAPFDVNLVRADFPILKEMVNGRRLVWLDNAATTQKPQAVIDRLQYFYEHENSNVHRAAHIMAARATDAYEQAREKVRGFLNASTAEEIVFVRGTTEAINLVAQSWGRKNIGKDDDIVVSWLEHHANIVPWQQLTEATGARLKVIPVDDSGQIMLDEYGKLLSSKTKLVSFAHVSNALGTVTPAKKMIEMAHAVGARVLLDGAQAVSHMRVDMQGLDPDWYVFSGHKLFGPTGIGVLYGKQDLLNQMPPWQGGGNMISDVTFERTLYQPAPSRFEAGTGNIADAVGLGAAIDYVSKLGLEMIGQYEHELLHYATRLLKDIPGLRLIGTAPEKAGVLSFVIDGHKTESIGAALNQDGIAVRSGHHCAQPILRRFGVESSVRASLAFYNTCAEVDAMIATLNKLVSTRHSDFGGAELR